MWSIIYIIPFLLFFFVSKLVNLIISKESINIILTEVRKKLFKTNEDLKVTNFKITNNKKQGEFTKT